MHNIPEDCANCLFAPWNDIEEDDIEEDDRAIDDYEWDAEIG